jgi:hypothetical protein
MTRQASSFWVTQDILCGFADTYFGTDEKHECPLSASLEICAADGIYRFGVKFSICSNAQNVAKAIGGRILILQEKICKYVVITRFDPVYMLENKYIN